MKSAAASVTRCLTLCLAALLSGCAAKKPVMNMAPHKPQGEEAKFWRNCQEVTAVTQPAEQKTFQCEDVDGGLYLVKFTKLGNK